MNNYEVEAKCACLIDELIVLDDRVGHVVFPLGYSI
jgi:hypothetical protein